MKIWNKQQKLTSILTTKKEAKKTHSSISMYPDKDNFTNHAVAKNWRCHEVWNFELTKKAWFSARSGEKFETKLCISSSKFPDPSSSRNFFLSGISFMATCRRDCLVTSLGAWHHHGRKTRNWMAQFYFKSVVIKWTHSCSFLPRCSSGVAVSLPWRQYSQSIHDILWVCMCMLQWHIVP